ncbi:MAG: hypothetical protein AAB425_06570, partial [Bdellovibrionota bacterium]
MAGREHGFAGIVVASLLLLFSIDPAPAAERKASGAIKSYTLEKGMSLSQVGILLYGDPKYGDKIARWNGIRNPKDVDPGTVLRLNEPPKVSPAKGQRILLEYWRKKMSDWEQKLGDIPKSGVTS